MIISDALILPVSQLQTRTANNYVTN